MEVFTVELDPGVAQVTRDLEKTFEEVFAGIMKELSDDLPDEMRSLMPSGGVSSKGEPPRRRSGVLANSLEGKVISSSSVEISMANHAFYLDPLFEGMEGGGGWANRPFILPGIDRKLEKLN